jgi:hypothetical protein
VAPPAASAGDSPQGDRAFPNLVRAFAYPSCGAVKRGGLSARGNGSKRISLNNRPTVGDTSRSIRRFHPLLRDSPTALISRRRPVLSMNSGFEGSSDTGRRFARRLVRRSSSGRAD